MKKLPNKVSAGDSIKAKDFNDMIDYLRSITLREGTGYRVNTSAGGTSLNVRPSVGGGGSVAPVVKPRPLEITLSRPSYIDPETLPTINPETQFLFWIYPGLFHGVSIADNFATYIGAKTQGPVTAITRIYGEMEMSQSEDIGVMSAEISVGSETLDISSPWNSGLTRPQTIRVLLGSVFSRNGGMTLVGSEGNVLVVDSLTRVSNDGSFVRQVVTVRE